jgi:glycine/D-amino acid oxidase-like deaminating enzyme
MNLLIPPQSIPVLAEADVVVCGGGVAGVSAAVSAARGGARVVLLERWPTVGGMATNGLVNIWHTSDRTKQVIFGLVQELVERGGEWVRRRPDYPSRPETHDFDSHAPKGSGHTTWLEQQAQSMPPLGQSYYIPYGMCVNAGFANLAMAGRCAWSTHEAHASVRLQTHCMVMGQAVGTAAALALAGSADFRTVDVPALQDRLRPMASTCGTCREPARSGQVQRPGRTPRSRRRRARCRWRRPRPRTAGGEEFLDRGFRLEEKIQWHERWR